jgi:hypothetical protein
MQASAIQTTLEALHYHYDVKKDAMVEKILSLANEWIEGKEDIESFFQRHIEDIFAFRMYAINLTIKNNLLNEVEERLHQPFGELEEPRYDNLMENVNFALKIFSKVDKKIRPDEEPMGDVLLEPTSLHNFIHTASINSVISKQNWQKWFSYSLGVEFGLIVAKILAFEGKNKLVSEEKINALANFVRDSAQSFGGMVRTFGFVKVRDKITSTEEHPEDMLLAEQGIEEFAHELENT